MTISVISSPVRCANITYLSSRAVLPAGTDRIRVRSGRESAGPLESAGLSDVETFDRAHRSHWTIRIRTSNGAILESTRAEVGDTIVYVSVYDEKPSPGAGLLRYARLKAGLSQSELAKRAGVPRTMVSAYEHDRRQATLPTLMRLLKAAGFELRMQLAPYDDHDDVLRELEAHRSPEDRRSWEDYQATRVAKDRAAVSVALRARKKAKVPG